MHLPHERILREGEVGETNLRLDTCVHVLPRIHLKEQAITKIVKKIVQATTQRLDALFRPLVQARFLVCLCFE